RDLSESIGSSRPLGSFWGRFLDLGHLPGVNHVMPERPAAPDEFSRAIERFVEHLALERRFSRHTASAYRRDLEQLADFTRRQTRSAASPKDVTKLVLRAFLGKLAETRVAASVARKLAAIRSFLRYLVRQGEIEDSVADLVGTPRIHRRLPVFLS